MKRQAIFPILAMLAIGLAGCNSCGGGRSWFGNRNNCCDPCCDGAIGFSDGGFSDGGCCGAGGVIGDGYGPGLQAPAIQTVPGTTYVPGPT
jgi:hypothetical protein